MYVCMYGNKCMYVCMWVITLFIHRHYCMDTVVGMNEIYISGEVSAPFSYIHTYIVVMTGMYVCMEQVLPAKTKRPTRTTSSTADMWTDPSPSCHSFQCIDASWVSKCMYVCMYVPVLFLKPSLVVCMYVCM